jgi:bifunctional ADP-heptose synthase (sugar kinase/adenylyltransferase)
MAGGPAHVALNTAAIGARVAVIGIVGEDAAGSRLREHNTKALCSGAAELVIDLGRPITRKIRSNEQQMMQCGDVDHQCYSRGEWFRVMSSDSES